MIIKILTMMYNEEFLLPFFLSHYLYADEIHVLLDSDSNDNTRKILENSPNVTIEDFTFPDMMDDFLKADFINKTLKTIEADWIFVIDADEFIFPDKHKNPRAFLEKVEDNVDVIMANMWQVYRNVKDKDLNISKKPVILQRRYGDPNRTEGINALYCKPIILKTPITFDLSPGNHHILGDNYNVLGEYWAGAHWAMADPNFSVDRRVKGRKERQSQKNLDSGLTYHQHTITKKQILDECKEHENDPKLF